ncbi:hypothetical protein CASFOL_040900 [Castilleja foliolosa]|uniref:Gnk2-homologous domain-containing protein n=1 Tax=Castilleja foliolosa TaxID=1961234 RepID=A0ABD3BDA0_9LAMI
MSYNNYLIISILMIITIYLLNNIPIALSIEENDTELGYICLSSKASTMAYIRNQESVINDLTNNTSLLGGYSVAVYNTTSDSDDSVFGHALCRGDVTSDECNTCVRNATDSDPCIGSRSGTVWRKYCMVKYSDVNFLETIDTNAFRWTDDIVWMDQSSVYVTKVLMDSVKRAAINNITMYATGEAYVKDYGIVFTLQGMVQCTRDMSADYCKACLDRAIDNLDTRKRGGGVVCGSCYAKFKTI